MPIGENTNRGVCRLQDGLALNRKHQPRQNRNYENGNSEVFETSAHRIELIEFKIRQPLYNGQNITDTFGWIWRVEKINNENENLETYCIFKKQIDEVEFDTACGEHLDAVEISSKEWTLHIGTEDGEALNSRAENEDDFPMRLLNKADFYNSITKRQENGFRTEINLKKPENLHIQYLIAYDKRDRTNVNTWLAVDEFKRKLENWIGIGW